MLVTRFYGKESYFQLLLRRFESHKIHNFKPKGPKDKRTFAQRQRQNPAVNRNEVTTRHCGPLEARVARVFTSVRRPKD